MAEHVLADVFLNLCLVAHFKWLVEHYWSTFHSSFLFRVNFIKFIPHLNLSADSRSSLSWSMSSVRAHSIQSAELAHCSIFLKFRVNIIKFIPPDVTTRGCSTLCHKMSLPEGVLCERPFTQKGIYLIQPVIIAVQLS